jgi:hypothetical protein
MHALVSHNKFWAIAICFLIGFSLVQSPESFAIAEQTKEEKARQRMLNREVANALWRLKKSIEEDGFYSGRVRLNVWRMAAIEAGKFDPEKYEEFKKQLYEKSVKASLKCFEHFIEQNNHHDADMCVQTWKMHAQEIGIFDEPTYQEYVKRLERLKEKQTKPE